jgi:hypothetical protein
VKLLPVKRWCELLSLAADRMLQGEYLTKDEQEELATIEKMAKEQQPEECEY